MYCRRWLFLSDWSPAPPHYIYDKMVGGLTDAYLYAGNTQPLDHLARITDWAGEETSITPTKSCSSPSSGLLNGTRWVRISTVPISRPARHDTSTMPRAGSTPTTGICLPIQQISFGPSPGYHAYSHVNTLQRAASAYLVSGEKRYLDLIRNAYEYFQAHQVYATGGYGPGEQFLPEAQLREYLDTMDNHFETQCGSWAAFKLSKYLISFTGDARYGDGLSGW